MPEPNNPWRTVSSRIIHRSRYLTIHEDDVIAPNGLPDKYTYVESPPFVLIVGYDGQRFIMVRQYRYTLKRVMTEFPGGSVDNNESALDAAKREFEEETGLTAKKWTQLGVIHNPNLATVFLAEELTNTGRSKMAEDGIAEVIQLMWTDIDSMIANTEFTDSKTLACLLLYERCRERRQDHLQGPSL